MGKSGRLAFGILNTWARPASASPVLHQGQQSDPVPAELGQLGAPSALWAVLPENQLLSGPIPAER